MMRAVPTAFELLEGDARFAGQSEVEAFLRALDGTRMSADGFIALARSAGEQLATAVSGTVSELSVELEELIVPGGTTLYESSDSAWWAFSCFLDENLDVRVRAERVEQRLEDALAQIEESMREVEVVCAQLGCVAGYGWDSQPSRTPPAGAQGADGSFALWSRAVSRWAGALADVENCKAEWRALLAERERSEERLVQALSDTAIGSLAVLSAAAGATVESTVASRFGNSSLGAGWTNGRPNVLHPGLYRLFGSADGSRVWSSPPDADELAARWRELPPELRDALISEVPWVIGSLPGLPFADRDRANRLMVEFYLLHEHELDSRSRRLLADTVSVAYGSDQSPPVSIVALNFEGEVPFAAVGYGELDSSEYLTWAVPGMFNDADRALGAWDKAMRAQYQEQELLLKRIVRGDDRAALIAFLSYDTPDQFSVLGAGAAREGAVRLAAELDGGFATREANTPFVRYGAEGHSYGTTTLAEALLLTQHPLDHATFVGSAGLADGLSDLAELNVKVDERGRPEVYTALASSDLLARVGVTLSGRLQPNPEAALTAAQRVDGARSFSVEGTEDLLPTEGHGIVNANGTGYFNRGTQSSLSMAAIALGELDEAPGGLSRESENQEVAAPVLSVLQSVNE